MEEAVYWFSVVLLGSVWLGVVAAPGQAVTPVDSPLPWQVEGVLPHVPANGVGTLGAIVAAWSLGRFFWPLPEGLGRRAPSLLMALFGLVSLIASQYRTGYIAFAIAVIVLLLLRGKGVLNLFIVLAMIGAVFWGRAVLDEAQPVLLRGESAQTASQLSSRLEWWERALPVWTESPIVGKGLLTGTRFEVLGSIGRQETSTIHSTWIEALVGTGLVGTALLAASFLVLFRRSVVEAVGRKGRIVPLLLLIVLGVRSLTGTTFEASGRSVLLFLVLGLALADRWFGRENDRGRPIGALEGGSPGPLPTSP